MITREDLSSDDVVAQARGLLGVHITTRVDGQLTTGRIVETEAYRGRDDKAAHSYNYKRTARTEVFFGAAGHAYVYLCYGIHRMFNIIVGPVGEPNAILIRAIEPVAGIATMLARRQLDQVERRVGGGPGLVCQALGIELQHNACDLFDPYSPIQLAGKFDQVAASGSILASPRVGVAYAQECAQWPWRFRESGSDFTSPAK